MKRRGVSTVVMADSSGSSSPRDMSLQVIHTPFSSPGVAYINTTDGSTGGEGLVTGLTFRKGKRVKCLNFCGMNVVEVGFCCHLGKSDKLEVSGCDFLC